MYRESCGILLNVTGEEPQGWYEDPFRLHDARYFSAGRPTRLVRDGNVESYDEPPGESQPEPGVVRTLARAEGEDVSASSDDLPPDMPRRSRAGLVTIAAVVIVVAGIVTAAVLASKPAPATVSISPAAFVNQSLRRTLLARTADIALSGSISELGESMPFGGTGQIDFSTNDLELSLTLRGSGHSMMESEIQTEKNLYFIISFDGRPSGKWVESPIGQSGPGTNPVSWLLALTQHGHVIQKLGTKVIDGVTCTGYSVAPVERGTIVTVGYDSPPTGTVTVWFDARGLLRQVSGSSDDPSTDMVLNLSDYGTRVRISAPPPSDTTSDGALFGGS